MKATRWIPILWAGLLMGGLPLATTLSVYAEDGDLFPLLEELDSEEALPVLEEELPLLPANEGAVSQAPLTQAPVFVAQQPGVAAETIAVPDPPAEISVPSQAPVEIPVVEAISEPTATDDLLTPPVASPQAPLTEESTVIVPNSASIVTDPLPGIKETPATVLPPAAPVPPPTAPSTNPQSVVVSQTEAAAPSGAVVTETVIPSTTAVPCQECYEYVPVYPRRAPAVRHGMPLPMGRAYSAPARGYGGRSYERGTRRLLPDTGYTLRGPRDFEDPNPRPIGP